MCQSIQGTVLSNLCLKSKFSWAIIFTICLFYFDSSSAHLVCVKQTQFGNTKKHFPWCLNAGMYHTRHGGYYPQKIAWWWNCMYAKYWINDISLRLAPLTVMFAVLFIKISHDFNLKAAMSQPFDHITSFHFHASTFQHYLKLIFPWPQLI